MKVKLIEKQVTEWIKVIFIEREGQEFQLTLAWDIHNGYQVDEFLCQGVSIPTPEWAKVPEFEYDLDCETEDQTNA